MASLVDELRRTVGGEVRFDRGSRGLYARDASNFRMVPIGVVVPRNSGDVVATVAACHRHEVPILPRGGGTSLAGQAVNTAVVLDFTRHMNRIVEIDPARRLARVQPGAVLDDLRRRAGRHGLTFGPDPATHDHCTIGGMIGNNACGVHAVMAEFYGPGPRMQDNVRELDVLTSDGERMRVGPTSAGEYAKISAAGGRRSRIYTELRALARRYARDIRERFPDIPRRVSGYSLPSLLPENGFQVAHALTGSEGTCATVLEATVELIPALMHRSLLVLGFEDVFAAGDAVPAVRALEDKPIGCEGLDDILVEDIRRKNLHAKFLSLLPRGRGWLLVQFGASVPGESEAMARRALARLRGEIVDHRLFGENESEERSGIWEVRESGLGATAFVPGDPDTWPGWEDSAVPPDRVGPYLRRLRSLFDEFGYGSAAVYGHFAQGCIHTRVPFDFRSPGGLETYRGFTQKAARLVVDMGGSLSGEHGDGQQRGDLLPVMFGPDLMQAFREFKRIWDPGGLMNPGKVVDAMPRFSNLVVAGSAPRPGRTHFAFSDDQGDMSHAALRCVGVGKCRRLASNEGVMCPSFMVTREEKHTTRGRAHLLYEMLEGGVVDGGWKSEEVREALDLCLSCKGCTQDCPVHVDIPTMKAEFLSHYWRGRIRPRHAYAFGLIHRWARIGSLVPEAVNLVTRTPGLRTVAKWAVDMHPDRDVPKFASRTFRSRFRPAFRGGQPRVLLWPDTFNNHFSPDTLRAAADVLAEAGCRVVIPSRPLCCGRPLFHYGMLARAAALWRGTLGDLEEEIRSGTPVVVIEPSCLAAFHHELPGLFPDDELAGRLRNQTYTLAAFLRQRVPDWRPPRLERQEAIAHFHCHDRAVQGNSEEEQLLADMGIEIRVPQATCCGMAGSWGMERDHYDLSMDIGELALLPEVRRAPRDTLVIANGFSCRNQILEATGRQPLHIAGVLRLGASGPASGPTSGEGRAVASGLSPGARLLIGAGVLTGAGLAYRAVRRRSASAPGMPSS